MSEQNTEMNHRTFEYHGDCYSLVEQINNLADLNEAMRIRDLLEQYKDEFEPNSAYPFLDLFEHQEGVINDYLSELGDFDNRYLVNNISYLAKNNDLRIGDVEKILGISVGYISRTANEKSGKKLSIDVVWKIARLFKVNIRDLVETDLSMSETASDIIRKFLSKLLQKTVENKINWVSYGGNSFGIDKKIEQLGIINKVNGKYYYNRNIPNKTLKWVLSRRIYAYPSFDLNRELVIISTSLESEKEGENKAEPREEYDFLLIQKDGKTNGWETMFSSSDDVLGDLDKYASKLVDEISFQELEPVVIPEHRKLIANFLREDN